MGEQEPTPQRFWRYFIRGEEPGDFEDRVADETFAQKNFIDFFGKIWVPNNPTALSFDAVVTPFFEDQNIFFQIFAVSDGSVVQSTSHNPWLKQNIRFIAFAAGNDKQKQASPFDNNGSWTLCIVGSSAVKSNNAFLQVASWNGKSFRYYERANPKREDTKLSTWIYLGYSTDAFDEHNSYLGPFNGHVNGSLVMKELQPPWLHWLADGNNFTGNISDEKLAVFDKIPYLSDIDDDTNHTKKALSERLSKVKSANLMQKYIEAGITKWLNTRRQNDFFDDKSQPRIEVKNMKRWLAHILLTTTINIGTAQRNTGQGAPPDQWIFAGKHFYNTDLFGTTSAQGIQPSKDVGNVVFNDAAYAVALDKTKLALVQSGKTPDPEKHPTVHKVRLGDGRVLEAFVVQYGEGEDVRHNIVQPSFEDVQGALTVLSNSKQKTPLLSTNCIFALLMVDPWNPVYSWRRGVLLQYVPDVTRLSGSPPKYDLEATLEAAVRDSPRFKNEPDSPEQEFIKNLDAQRQGNSDFSDRMTTYLKKVKQRLSDPAQANEAVTDYVKLAESRRRIYRPLPLDEFDLTMPWATVWPEDESPSACLEMRSDGTVQNVPPRGRTFFTKWIDSLSGADPQMMPPPDKDDAPGMFATAQSLSFMALADRSFKLSCQTSTNYASRLAHCPAFSRTRSEDDVGFVLPEFKTSAKILGPTWNETIRDLFAAPFWIEPPTKRVEVGTWWTDMMKYYGAPIPPSDPHASNLGLDNYDQVKEQAITIYQHVASRSMPITSDPSQYWPETALELLRAWINQGCRQTSADPIVTVPNPTAPLKAPLFRTRKDVHDLTPEELLSYRTKLTEVLEVMSLKSKWQDLGQLHAWWCLHYQEATFFWHRCFLRYIEELIDFPIPYWNGFATDAADPGSPNAGIPSIFLEDTYRGTDGKSHKNPLKWAYSYGGKSKSDPSKSNCQRNPIIEKGRPDQPGPERDAWNKHMKLFAKYHQQIVVAMQQPVFSLPQYNPSEGVPAEAAWASLPAFTEDMPDNDYAVAWGTFDGHFEQAHDNFHGWVGGTQGEMADNTYTAFDPIFLSYHCNMDRLFEHYLRSHPNTRVTAAFPLKPFTNKATDLEYTNPNSWAYTSTGEVAQPTMALGYAYAPPASPDVFKLPDPSSRTPQASGGVSMSLVSFLTKEVVAKKENIKKAKQLKPSILFEDVICTQKSYEIDIFLRNPSSEDPDPENNPDFVGRLFRFGMGEPPAGVELKNKSRCMKESVTRVVDADDQAGSIGSRGWYQTVKEIDGSPGGRLIPEEEWRKMRGFTGRLVWMMS